MTTQEEIARLIHRVEAKIVLYILSRSTVAADGSLIVPTHVTAEIQRFAAVSFDELFKTDREAAMKGAAAVISIILESESE